MSAIYKRELKSYFTNMSGYVIVAGLLLFEGIYFVVNNMINAYPGFEYSIAGMGLIYLLASVFVTMGSLSTERRRKTDQLLLTSPVSVSGIIAGKFFAMLTLFAIPTAVMCIYPLILTLYGTVSLAAAYGGLLTLLFLSAACVAIGLFISSLTENIIISAAATLGTLLIVYFFSGIASILPATAAASFIAFGLAIILACILIYALTKSTAVTVIALVAGEGALVAVHLADPALLEGSFPALLEKLSLFTRYSEITNGMFDLTTIVLYITVALFFCFLAKESIERRRWS